MTTGAPETFVRTAIVALIPLRHVMSSPFVSSQKYLLWLCVIRSTILQTFQEEHFLFRILSEISVSHEEIDLEDGRSKFYRWKDISSLDF